jgi:hypothetical protein
VCLLGCGISTGYGAALNTAKVSFSFFLYIIVNTSEPDVLQTFYGHILSNVYNNSFSDRLGNFHTSQLKTCRHKKMVRVMVFNATFNNISVIS